MKIISTQSKQFKCFNCNTVAEYEDSDIQLIIEPPGYDEYENYNRYYVNCPVCAKKHTVNVTTNQKNIVLSSKNNDYY
jgi:Zn finger protein HypA/HybF involved in hydrogenase expression